MQPENYMRVVYLLLMILAVSGWVFVEYRRRLGPALRSLAAWGLIFLGGVAAYGLWSDIQRAAVPPQMAISGDEIQLIRAPDGHFYLSLDINGIAIPFMVDTGATNMVLSQSAADDLGLKLTDLDYLGRAQTANGTVRTARVKLDEVRLGDYLDKNVTAWVNEGEMETSLLGMSYLRAFSIRIDGPYMVLSR